MIFEMDNDGNYVSNNDIVNITTDSSDIPTLSELQAQCFLLDAEEYRSVQHKLDPRSLEIYRLMYSRLWQLIVFVSIVALHLFAFIESPSSLSTTSLVNSTIPRGGDVPLAALITFEVVFLAVIFTDTVMQAYLFGAKTSLRSPWYIGFFVAMVVSCIDIVVNISIGSTYLYRVRRFCRPVFALQKSQLMKKVLKSLSKTFADMMSVCLLLLLWLVGFTLLAVSLFSGFTEDPNFDIHFMEFYQAFFHLLVLLTTANNPDVMIKEYNNNRLSFLFFFIFMAVGIFVFMNVLIAIVFNEFRGHVLDSMQTSLLRRRIACRAMFEVLKKSVSRSGLSYGNEIEADVLKRVIWNSPIASWRRIRMIRNLDCLGSEVVDWENVKIVLEPLDEVKDKKMRFSVPKFDRRIFQILQKFLLSKSFEIIGLLVCLANVITIAVDISYKYKIKDKDMRLSKQLQVLNWIFVSLYVVEQVGKFIVMGYRIYFSRRGCIFDFFITMLILMMKFVELILVDIEKRNFKYLFGVTSVWDLPRITNLLVMLRAVRIVLLLPSLTPIINTLFDIPWRLRSVLGLLALLFYVYALMGMIIFQDSITPQFMAQGFNNCGSYQQLNYGALNFNDFYSSIVVLWCLLIVNNWHVFMTTFETALHTRWVHLYMISWWVLAVVVVLNCVTAFVIEGYTQRKSFFDEERVKRMRPTSISEVVDESIQYLQSSVVGNNSYTFQMLFRNDLIEPNEEELMCELKKCQFLCHSYPHIAHSQYDC